MPHLLVTNWSRRLSAFPLRWRIVVVALPAVVGLILFALMQVESAERKSALESLQARLNAQLGLRTAALERKIEQLQIPLDAADPSRALYVTLAASDDLVAEAIAAARSTTLLGLSGGALIFVVLLYSYWLSLRHRRQVSIGHARLAAIVESSDDAIIGKTLDGVVTDWNRAAERIFGYKADEAVRRTLLSLIVPEEQQPEEADILRRIASGERVPHFVTQRRRSDGNLIDVAVTVSPICNERGEIVGAAKTVRDITRLKAAERALRSTEERLAVATKVNGIGIWELNPITRELIIDDTMFELYGRRREDYPSINAAWFASLHPEDAAHSDQALADALAGVRPLDTSFRIITGSGEIRHIRTRATVAFDASGRAVRVLGTNYDCTAEKERERQIDSLNTNLEAQVAARTTELNELSALQRAILVTSTYIVITTDLKGTITLFNPAAERLFGYSSEEVVGKLTPKIFHDPAEVVARAAALNAELGLQLQPGFEVFVAKARHGTPDTNEWTFLRKDGSRFPVLLTVSALHRDGEIFGYLGMIVDLREQRRNEQTLRESERFLRGVTDNNPAMIGYWDADFRLRFANKAFEKSSGKRSADLMGFSIEELLGREGLRHIEPYARRALQGFGQVFERVVEKQDGRRLCRVVNLVPDIDDDKVKGFYAISSDVTELKEAQINLEALNSALEARSREAEAATVAKSQFLANMSHEIRSPMNAILGMQRLLLGTPLSEQQRDYADKAQSATQSLLHLLNDILDFSKAEAGKIEMEHEPFGVGKLMQDLAVILHASIGTKPVAVVFSLDPRLPSHLHGDAFRLRQILLNLAGNAIKFTESGEVVVAMQVLSQDSERAEIEIAVRDTGIGIAPDKLAAVFEGFSQAEASTTRRYGGSGLGLAISQRLVALMGGALKVESEFGKGSRFYFSLTLDKAREADLKAESTAPATRFETGQKRLAGLRLLVVEDNALNQQVARELLSKEGAVVAIADSGAGGVAMTMSAQPPFDAVLMDVQMPDIDGYEATRRIRAQNYSLPILAMTANAMASDRAASRAARMDDHIAKPIDLDVVVATILRHCKAPSESNGAYETPPAAEAGSADEFEIEKALKRLGGDRTLYAGLAHDFAKDAPTTAIEIRRLVREGAHEIAARHLHTLRSLAGTVGMRALVDLILRIEKRLRTGEILDLDRDMAALDSILATGPSALMKTLSDTGFAAADEDSAELEPDAAGIVAKLVELEKLLKGSNFRAVGLFAELQQQLGGPLAERLRPLADAISRLDFKRAHEECGNVRRLVA